MYQNTPKSKQTLGNLEHTYLHSIKALHYYNSAVKYIYMLPTVFKSHHLTYASTSILHVTTIILWYYRKFLKF